MQTVSIQAASQKIQERSLRSNRSKVWHAVQWALTTACLCVAVGGATAREHTNSLTPACAERDLQLAILIEEYGSAQNVAPEKLAEAYFTMIRARNACAEGREREAIVLFDSIAFGTILPRQTR